MMGAVPFEQFDTTLTIESATTVNHVVTNEPEETWSTFKTKKAKELGPASKEQIEAKQSVALSTVRWQIRRDTTITEVMRIKRLRETTPYYISGIEDYRRQGFMIITAERRDNA